MFASTRSSSDIAVFPYCPVFSFPLRFLFQRTRRVDGFYACQRGGGLWPEMHCDVDVWILAPLPGDDSCKPLAQFKGWLELN